MLWKRRCLGPPPGVDHRVPMRPAPDPSIDRRAPGMRDKRARFRRPDPLLSLGLSVIAAVAATLLLPYL